MGGDLVIIRGKALLRVLVIQQVLDKALMEVKAAQALGLSTRQIRRLMGRVQ